LCPHQPEQNFRLLYVFIYVALLRFTLALTWSFGPPLCFSFKSAITTAVTDTTLVGVSGQHDLAHVFI
jgi:hypothetical protein